MSVSLRKRKFANAPILRTRVLVQRPSALGRLALLEHACVSSSPFSSLIFTSGPHFRSFPFVLPAEKSVVRSGGVF